MAAIGLGITPLFIIDHEKEYHENMASIYYLKLKMNWRKRQRRKFSVEINWHSPGLSGPGYYDRPLEKGDQAAPPALGPVPTSTPNPA
jgi:hypothetical protein